MKLSLVVQTPGNKLDGKALEIKLAQFVVGRDPQCHLRPASPLISKRHCALLQRDGKVFVRDFESTNGTFLNDQPVKGEVEIHNNDMLKIGPLLFRVAIEATPSVARPTPPPPTRAAATKKAARPAAAAAPAPQPAGEGAAAKPPVEAPHAPAPDPTPPPTPALASSSDGSGSPDDDVAAMLLSLQDDSSSGLAGEVPDGSTVHDMTVSPEMLAAADQARSEKESKDKKEADAKAKAAAANASTSAAAKTILEKYMRRPRQQP